MSIPHAVVCHIAEKNLTVEELNQFIQLLRQEHNFRSLGGPSYDGKRVHLGTILVKNISGDDTQGIFETAKHELEEIQTSKRIACRLTVVAIDTISEGIFI